MNGPFNSFMFNSNEVRAHLSESNSDDTFEYRNPLADSRRTLMNIEDIDSLVESILVPIDMQIVEVYIFSGASTTASKQAHYTNKFDTKSDMNFSCRWFFLLAVSQRVTNSDPCSLSNYATE